MKRKVLRCIAVAASIAAPIAALAQNDLSEAPIRNERYHVTYVLNPDGSHVETRETAVKILRQQALEYGKQSYVNYSTSVERAEILEAYTRKPDGRRVDAPQSNYQVDINQGRQSGAPAFSDRSRITVIFPDVAVDDVVVLKYRLTATEPMFPGHFSVTERFARAVPYDDVKVRLDAPASLWTQHATTGMTEAVKESQGDRRLTEWTWSNPAPAKSKRRDWSAYDPDKEPGYAISTFREYGAIAEAYGQRARPKAAVSERVRALAEEITRGKQGEREQARALYEWVATNIHFAGNCVGVGAVVPRDQAFVLDNKMGDCKDQATLLQSLLAARGIASTQALVNSGRTYSLPKVPVLSMVNHVIVYVPTLDLYLDTTSGTTPFGMLPMGDADKPVLHVDGYRSGVRTPAVRGENNRQHAKSQVTVKPDGSIAGVVQVAVKGPYAESGRSRLRNATREEREDVMKAMYRRNNKTGFGRLETDDPKPMLDTLNYKVSFETEEFAQVPGPGAFTISPLYFTDISIHMVGGLSEEETEAEESSCIGGTLVEEYVYRLPGNMKVLAIPKNVTLRNARVTYTSSYALKGDTLTVKRELVDKTSRNVCPISVQHEFAAMAKKIAADLKAQVVYQ